MRNSVATLNKEIAASVQNARLYLYNIPLSQPLLLNQSWVTCREGFIVELIFNNGAKGYGEAAPLKGFNRESLSECRQQLDIALQQLTSGNMIDIDDSAAKFALECALDKRLQSSPNSSQPLDGKLDQSIPLLVGEQSTILTKYKALHCPEKIKLKVARHTVEQDVSNIHALLGLNNNLVLNLDANKGWTIEQALAFSKLVPKKHINYIEEPCTTLAESLFFSNQSQLGIALDETLQHPSFELKADKAIKALIIKPTLIGSFYRCLKLIEQAKDANIACSLSSSYESSLGMSQLHKLANIWTPQQSYGFDTLEPLTFDILCDSGRNVPLKQLKDLELICQY